MVRVNVAKKSPKRASRSASTTASTAKRVKKEDSLDWSADDQLDAHDEGWGLYECVDEKTRKVFFEIHDYTTEFADASAARRWVMERARIGDALAIKAVRIEFTSKTGSKGKAR